MRRIWLAIRIFFLTLFSRDVARLVGELLAQRAAAAGAKGRRSQAGVATAESRSQAGRAASPAPQRGGHAAGHLAARGPLRRFRPGAARPIQRRPDRRRGPRCPSRVRQGARSAVRPAADSQRGRRRGGRSRLPAIDAGRYRLIGNVAGQPPFHGRLVHHGWEATVCQLPAWSGTRGGGPGGGPGGSGIHDRPIRSRHRSGHDQQRAGLCAAGRRASRGSRCWRSRNWWPPARSSRGRCCRRSLYLARRACRPAAALDLPWATGRKFAVGEFARRQGGGCAGPDRRGGQVVAGP